MRLLDNVCQTCKVIVVNSLFVFIVVSWHFLHARVVHIWWNGCVVLKWFPDFTVPSFLFLYFKHVKFKAITRRSVSFGYKTPHNSIPRLKKLHLGSLPWQSCFIFPVQTRLVLLSNDTTRMRAPSTARRTQPRPCDWPPRPCSIIHVCHCARQLMCSNTSCWVLIGHNRCHNLTWLSVQ